MIEITRAPIDVEAVLKSVEDPAAGGTALFVGTTRNHSDGRSVRALEYDAYIPMALKLMNRIAADVRIRWAIHKISIVHRIGRVEVGEASVAIAVSSSHRAEAFEGCRYAIDTLKSEVPIWKKEFLEDGEIWVGTEEVHSLM